MRISLCRLAATSSEIQNDARGPISEVMGGAGGPVLDDYLAAGFTEAEVTEYQAQERARVLGQPGVQVPVQLTEEQMQFGEEVGAPMLTATPGSEGAPLDFEMPPSGALERLAVAIGKGLVEGTAVSPLQFVLDTFGVQEPQILQDLDQALQLDEDASVLLEQLPKGIAQFFGPFAAVGKLLRLGRGFLPTMGQAAAADFLGFEGNEGRLTDVLLEFGLPPNAITEMLRTDPNDPEYIGRIKNAAEGALLGIPIEAVARVVSALRSGSAKELEDSLSEMQQGAQLSFRQRINNLTSDFVGAARATGRMDPEMMREIFQRGGQPRSLGAAGVDAIEDTIRQQYPDVTIDLSGNAERGYELSRIVIPEGQRESGLGTRVMEDIVRMADQQGARISLTPETSFGGTSVGRLTDFYKRFGFVENKGPNKDFSTRNTMYRDPQPRSLGAAGTGVDDAALVARTEEFLGQTAPDPETAGAITAFHGSPYDFDAFDITKMGTGEGAQAYGPGLYFAEAEGVAREYRDALSGVNLLTQGGTAKSGSISDRLATMFGNDGSTWSRGDRNIGDYAKRLAVGSEKGEDGETIYRFADGSTFIDFGDFWDVSDAGYNAGRMYEVNINANPEDFLNWDAPISQQSEKVRETLMPFVEQRIAQMGEAGNRFTPEQWMDRLRGGDVMLLDKVEDTPVSRALIEAGVPGVRYLDQGSRATAEGQVLGIEQTPNGWIAKIRVDNRTGVGFQSPTTMITTSKPFPTEQEATNWANAKTSGGTRNIVVFDDQLIDIVRKYGVAGLAVGAAVQSELGVNEQIEENI